MTKEVSDSSICLISLLRRKPLTYLSSIHLLAYVFYFAVILLRKQGSVVAEHWSSPHFLTPESEAEWEKKNATEPWNTKVTSDIISACEKE